MGKKRKRGRGEGTICPRPDEAWMGQITVGWDPQTRKQQRKTAHAATERECGAAPEGPPGGPAAVRDHPGAQKVRDALDLWLGQT
jgi:hypothetical protein